MSRKTAAEKTAYLRSLFDKIYLDDIMNRHKILREKAVLDDLLDITASSIGSLTNPLKIQKTFASEKGVRVSDETIATYLDYFADAFLISRAKRYDVKGRKHIGSPMKYYYTDIGLRNARLNFRQQEETHIMKDLHRAVDAMHHPYQYSDLELERALEAIQESPLKQFYKEYYKNLYKRILECKKKNQSAVGELGYFGG